MHGSHLTARLGSNKPHPCASQSLPFSHGCCIKAFLNLAKTEYFPDAKWSVKSFHFLLSRSPTGKALATQWQGTRTLQETAVLTWPGRAARLKAISSKGWIRASVCSQLTYAEGHKGGISYVPYLGLQNSLSTMIFHTEDTPGGQ